MKNLLKTSKYEFSSILNISFLVSIIFWVIALLRHYFFQSNAYDLGLFDQWIWLQSQGLQPFSSMTGLHIFADHGAWFLYIAAYVYKLIPNISLLLLSQSLSLCLTTIPIWIISRDASLDKKICFLICVLYLLQPVVFNVNLFDFHPEVWAMPFIAFSYLAERKGRFYLWLLSIFIILGTRDGLVLFVFGLSLEQLIKRKWIWSISSFALGGLWLYFLNNIIYPYLNKGKGSIMAIDRYSYLGENLNEIFKNLISNPFLILKEIDFLDSLFYIFILILPFIIFWRKRSLISLTSFLPLLMSNILSETYSQRTLIHHYSLPFAIIGTIAVIEGFEYKSKLKLNFKRNLIWLFLCWGMLAKPYFFTGPYLTRLNYIRPFQEIKELISSEDKVITTSYFVPHFSQRQHIRFPVGFDELETINNYDVLILNPQDPGWGSSSEVQTKFINKAKQNNWDCNSLKENLEICRRNKN